LNEKEGLFLAPLIFSNKKGRLFAFLDFFYTKLQLVCQGENAGKG